jgi:hypothetical protein
MYFILPTSPTVDWWYYGQSRETPERVREVTYKDSSKLNSHQTTKQNWQIVTTEMNVFNSSVVVTVMTIVALMYLKIWGSLGSPVPCRDIRKYKVSSWLRSSLRKIVQPFTDLDLETENWLCQVCGCDNGFKHLYSSSHCQSSWKKTGD